MLKVQRLDPVRGDRADWGWYLVGKLNAELPLRPAHLARSRYCMAYPRHVMQSLEVPAVTQVRASCDYHPGNTAGCSFPYCQWNIGTSSLLAWAVGIAPSKDGFWSTEVQVSPWVVSTTCALHRAVLGWYCAGQH